jgi:hypothetical protein
MKPKILHYKRVRCSEETVQVDRRVEALPESQTRNIFSPDQHSHFGAEMQHFRDCIYIHHQGSSVSE